MLYLGQLESRAETRCCPQAGDAQSFMLKAQYRLLATTVHVHCGFMMQPAACVCVCVCVCVFLSACCTTTRIICFRLKPTATHSICYYDNNIYIIIITINMLFFFFFFSQTTLTFLSGKHGQENTPILFYFSAQLIRNQKQKASTCSMKFN